MIGENGIENCSTKVIDNIHWLSNPYQRTNIVLKYNNYVCVSLHNYIFQNHKLKKKVELFFLLLLR